jgi:hypothetical protein
MSRALNPRFYFVHVGTKPRFLTEKGPTMWETTFPRNSHAGLGRDFTEMYSYSAVCSVRKIAYPIRRCYFSETLFPTWGCQPNGAHSVCDRTHVSCPLLAILGFSNASRADTMRPRQRLRLCVVRRACAFVAHTESSCIHIYKHKPPHTRACTRKGLFILPKSSFGKHKLVTKANIVTKKTSELSHASRIGVACWLCFVNPSLQYCNKETSDCSHASRMFVVYLVFCKPIIIRMHH